MAGVWLLAGAGYRLAQRSEVTADQVLAYAQSVDLAGLAGPGRAAAILKFEAMFNVLSLDERQQVWPEIISGWFPSLTEAERTQLLKAASLPGFNPVPNAFDLLPPERRQKAIEDTLSKLRGVRNQSLSGPDSATPLSPGANPP